MIYFSYAWGDKNEGGESREKIVDDLYTSLINDGYNVVRDKVSLGYRGLISDFIKDIGRGACIVVVISDKYLRSPYCMYELLEIYRKSGSEISQMKENIFPIVLGDAKIYGPVELLEYVNHWKKKKAVLDEKIREVGLDNAGGVLEDFRIYQEITSNFSQLTKLLQDMNTLNPVTLSKDNFTTIKKAIEALIPKPAANAEGFSTKEVSAGTNVTQPQGTIPLNAQTQNTSARSYNMGKLRKFLENALTDVDLDSICMDNFEKVYNSFGAGMSKTAKINLLLDHCRRNLKMDRLLEVIEQANPDQFEQYKPFA